MLSSGPIHARGRAILPGSGPFLFGILNCTPDSFSDGGSYATPADAVAAGLAMAAAGADAIDVGGESTRPGSLPVPPAEQINRTEGVIASLARHFGADGPVISIDTRSAEVGAAALSAGAAIINDISALRDDPDMSRLAVRTGAGVILMHMQGEPATMQKAPLYGDVVADIRSFLSERVDAACQAGISREKLLIDPGLGFGKTLEHNVEILRRLGELRSAEVPMMVGPSRKRFTATIAGDSREGRLWGTMGAVAACVLAGVECLRVHDVAECRAVAAMCAAIRRSAS